MAIGRLSALFVAASAFLCACGPQDSLGAGETALENAETNGGASTEADLPEIRGIHVRGGHIIGRADGLAQVSWEGGATRADENGWFFIGLPRSAPETFTFSIESGGARVERLIAVEQRAFRTGRRINRGGGANGQIVVSEADRARFDQRDGAIKARAWESNEANAHFAQGFIWPVAAEYTTRASGYWGDERRYNQGSKPHFGVDLLTPAGTQVVAPAAGRVVLVRELFREGNTLAIDHGQGVITIYLHLSEINVREGDLVEQGQRVARTGATGYQITGAHMCWRMRWRGVQVDPTCMTGRCLNPPSDSGAQGGDRGGEADEEDFDI
jgi:murein DD-endopeptidase MepM/ murein hydrolase activator NlpD